MLKIENWGNGLLIGRDQSRFTKYCPEMYIGYQVLRRATQKVHQLETPQEILSHNVGNAGYCQEKLR